jgi:hypothetical protein
MEEADLVGDSSHNILNVGCLAGFVRSQVTPELSMSMRIRPICKSHTCWLQSRGGVTLQV